jgi:hypothetical protein
MFVKHEQLVLQFSLRAFAAIIKGAREHKLPPILQLEELEVNLK